MLIDKFLKKGSDFLGVRYPIICGAMTWISDPKLIQAICEAGGFGFLAGGNMPVDILEAEIHQARRDAKTPFGVNLITIAPVYREQLQMVCDLGVGVIMFAGSIPREQEIRMAQDAGARVICFAPTAPLALRLTKMGADAIMLEGSEAGGHIGPVSLTVLLQQILFQVEHVPIFVAGGIATGRMMAHLLMMGAVGVQMGTRFVMSDECKAHPDFKRTFRRAKARDAVATPQFDSRLPVIPVRALKNESTALFGHLQLELMEKLDRGEIDSKGAQYALEHHWTGALRNAAIDGDVTKGSLMAGQSVGLVDKIMPIKEIIAELIQDGEAEMQRLKRIFAGDSACTR
jgi:enoyl-[acyl-carrier protein] reductase II